MKLMHFFTRRNVVICFFVMLVFFSVVCDDRIYDKYVIICAGDSLTYGSGVGKANRDTDSYPAQLQDYLGKKSYKVINCGRPNATASYEGDLPYVDTEEYQKSLNKKADLVLLMLGTNDSKTFNWDPDNYKLGLQKLVNSYKFTNPNVRIVLIKPPYAFSEDGSDVANYDIQPAVVAGELGPIIDEVAEVYGLQVIDLYEKTEGKTDVYTDGIHFNKDGYSIFANTIFNKLMEY